MAVPPNHSDRLAPLLERLRLRTSLFFTGELCGTTTFPARTGRGFLHVLRRGEVSITHRSDDGSLVRLEIDRPTLVFYPRPWEHSFHNAPIDGPDFTCAALDFDGGITHPLLRALPTVMVIPLDDVPALDPVLHLLFDEVDNVLCGHRLVADRLFEVVLIQLLRWIIEHESELDLPRGLFSGLADTALAPVLIAIHEQPDREWTLTTMAQAAMMSRSVFAERFKKTVGLAPVEYLTTWRLTLAQQALSAGAPVSTVARTVGYASASAFSRVFTQHLGRSPRDWATAARAGAGSGELPYSGS